MQKIEVENKFNEKIVAVIEGNENADTTVVLVHGFGTGKDEDLLIAISQALSDNLRILRFDFSGCGESGGTQEDINLEKHAGDLEDVLEFVKKEYVGKVFILAQSMGGFVTSFLSPSEIEKTIFTATPNGNIEFFLKCTKDKIKKLGTLNENGISIYPHTSGRIQKIGSSYWKVFKKFSPIETMSEFSRKTKLYILKPMQDEVVGNEYFENYKKIESLRYFEMIGDHNFSNKDDRYELIEKIKFIFNEK